MKSCKTITKSRCFDFISSSSSVFERRVGERSGDFILSYGSFDSLSSLASSSSFSSDGGCTGSREGTDVLDLLLRREAVVAEERVLFELFEEVVGPGDQQR